MNSFNNHLEKFHASSVLLDFLDAFDETTLTYYASDWANRLGYSNPEVIDQQVMYFVEALKTSGMRVSSHIKSVYRYDGKKMFHDWKISRLGLAYFLFNTPEKDVSINKLQLQVLSEYIKNHTL